VATCRRCWAPAAHCSGVGTRPSGASGRGHPRPLPLPAGLRLETLVKDPGGLGDVRWPGEDAVEQRVQVRVAPGSFMVYGLGFRAAKVRVAPAPHARGGGPLKTWAHRAPVRLHPRRQLLLWPTAVHAIQIRGHGHPRPYLVNLLVSFRFVDSTEISKAGRRRRC
jgi:hypothetical protein